MQILLLALPPNPLLFAAGDGFWLLLLLRLLAATAIGPTSVFASAAGLEETYMRTGRALRFPASPANILLLLLLHPQLLLLLLLLFRRELVVVFGA